MVNKHPLFFLYITKVAIVYAVFITCDENIRELTEGRVYEDLYCPVMRACAVNFQ